MTSEIKCEICGVQIPKYKCPTCRCRYCSVPCYKSHKETPCKPKVLQEHTQSQKTDHRIQGILSNTDHDTEVTEDMVPLEKLKQLGESQEVKSLLNNPHLRQMLTNLTKADISSVSSEMEQAMQEPIFTEFADQCLNIVKNDNQLKLEPLGNSIEMEPVENNIKMEPLEMESFENNIRMAGAT